jgi:RNA polymerase sigma factor (sigma-70 family)
VLAEAMSQKEEMACRQFEADYFEFACRQAGKISPRFAFDTDWWNDLVADLGGYLQPPGKLANFAGRCGLRNWLGTVVKNYVRRRHEANGILGRSRPFVTNVPRARPQVFDPDGARDVNGMDFELPESSIVSDECLRLFRQLIQQAVESLDESARVLLLMLFVEGMSGKEVAAILGIHPGNVARRKEDALQALQRSMRRLGQLNDSYQECLDHFVEGSKRKDLADALVEALQSASIQGAVT